MTPACRRCPEPKMALITSTRGRGPSGEVIEVQVALCQPCRQKAAKENQAAKERMTGKDVRP